jgi:hypothetical protein
MKQSLLKYSAWISLVFVLCASCSSSRIFVSGDEAGKIRESILSNSFDKITCKAKVTFHDNELSGLMLIKKTADGNYRLAFYNELGMTYLEGLFMDTEKRSRLIIKNIIPALNYKSFVKSFEKSLQLLFSEKNRPIVQSPNRPIAQPPDAGGSLKIQLRNGFRLELSPQITQINTE